jgi:hypothetical protein
MLDFCVSYTKRPLVHSIFRLISCGFPTGGAGIPRYLVRDRDATFGDEFRGQLRDMGPKTCCQRHGPLGREPSRGCCFL